MSFCQLPDRQKGWIMAKYLGGIKDPDIEVTAVSRAFFSSDFYIEHYNYKSEFMTVKKYSIMKSIVRYEEITAEKNLTTSYSLTWGLAGYYAGGPLGAAIGAVLGAGGRETEKHVVFCELDNGWQFAVELNKEEFAVWKDGMDGAVKLNKKQAVDGLPE